MLSISQHNEETFEGKNGLKLFSQNWTPDGSSKATLIIVHGLHDYSTRYAGAAEDLVKQGYAVYAFDLPGHGKSEGKRQSIGSFDEYLEDLDRFVKRVQSKELGKPLFMFGFSMGANIVATYLLDKKTDIKGVILAAPGLKAPDSTPKIAIILLKSLVPLLPNMGTARQSPSDFSRDPVVVAEMGKDPLLSWKPVPARTILGVVRTGEKLRREAGDFSIPFLMLQGSADKLVSPEGSKIFYERSHSTDKTFKLYENVNHDLLHEPEKQTVMNDISNWLEKHS